MCLPITRRVIDRFVSARLKKERPSKTTAAPFQRMTSGSSCAKTLASLLLKSDEAVLSAATGFLAFVNGSPSPFHAVQEAKRRLLEAGFVPLDEKAPWTGSAGDLKPGGKYFLDRQGTTLVSFVIGKKFKPGQHGFHIIGAHTDSPCLKVRDCLMLSVPPPHPIS
jgi:hypothetical protein